MEYLIGVVLGVVVCVFALLTGFDQDRAFYPTVLAVIPTYYILFAAMASSTQAVVIESAVTSAFWALAVVGFKKSLMVDFRRSCRTRGDRFLSSRSHSEFGCSGVLARFLRVNRCFSRRLPGRSPYEAFRIRGYVIMKHRWSR